MPFLRRTTAFLLIACLAAVFADATHAQSGESYDGNDIVKATDVSIPNAPAFTLLGTNPSKVVTPTFPRDFRLDLVSNGDQILPNVAVQAAPVWVLGYGDISVSEYQDRPYISRMLSTLNVSVGTVREQGASNTQQRLAAALTLRLAGYDPLTDQEYIDDIENALEVPAQQAEMSRTRQRFLTRYAENREVYRQVDAQLQTAIDSLAGASCGRTLPMAAATIDASLLPDTVDVEPIQSVVDRMRTLRTEMCELTVSTQEERIQQLRNEQAAEHWNDASLEIAGGNVWTYNQPEIDPNLRFVGVGYGAWINSATGLGTENALVSTLARVIRSNGDNSYFVGINVRYGSNDLNLFVEYAHDFLPLEQHLNTIAYGGGFDLSKTLNVQFGLRHEFDGGLDPVQLVPVVKINGKTANLLSAVGL